MAANIPDLETLLKAGIDPKTGLPVKMGKGPKCTTKEDIKKFLRLIDEQDAVNRYVWYNLPANLTSQELERMLYYKGQLCFFYDKDLEEFYFMPYALDGTIDFYGRYNTIHPIPMTSGTDDKGNTKAAIDEKKMAKMTEIEAAQNAFEQLSDRVKAKQAMKQRAELMIKKADKWGGIR